MLNLQLSRLDYLPNPMIVDFDVFSTSVIHRLAREMDCTQIVAVQDRWVDVFVPQLCHHVPQPHEFLTSFCDGPILSFRGRQSNRRL